MEGVFSCLWAGKSPISNFFRTFASIMVHHSAEVIHDFELQFRQKEQIAE